MVLRLFGTMMNFDSKLFQNMPSMMPKGAVLAREPFRVYALG